MTDSTRLRERLQALPEIELPKALWHRVRTGGRRKMHRRKLALGAASLGLVVVMATAMLGRIPRDPDPRPAPVAMAPGTATQDKASELRAIDQALQAAYDRGASDAEIAPMWVMRDALLAAARTDPPKPSTDRT